MSSLALGGAWMVDVLLGVSLTVGASYWLRRRAPDRF